LDSSIPTPASRSCIGGAGIWSHEIVIVAPGDPGVPEICWAGQGAVASMTADSRYSDQQRADAP